MPVDGRRQDGGARLWTWSFALVLAAMHLFFLGFFGTFTALPLYLADRATDWEIGVVVGVQAAAALAVRPFSGRLVDRYGGKRFQVWGAFFAGVSLLGHALSPSPVVLIPFRVLQGVSLSVFPTASLTAAADAAPESRRGEAMGYYMMVNNLAQLYGPWLAFFLVTQLGFPTFFLLAGAASVVGAVLGVKVRESRKGAATGTAQTPLFLRRALLPAGIFLSMTIAYSSVQAFLALFATRLNLGDPGLFFICFGAALVLLRVASGAFSDRWGRRAVIVPGMTIAGLAMLLLASAVPALFFPAAVTFGAGFAMGHTGLLALTTDMTSVRDRGAAMATFTLAWDAGNMLGSLGMGIVAAVAGYESVFWLAAVLPMLGLLTFLTIRPAAAPAGA
jgi:MFS family permease